ncbi:MAG: hypothetical protein SGI71_00165 [Verrucomicrobiota bacterium]|nr:hypothetical protein [Verrucomicrobiota bacterium]
MIKQLNEYFGMPLDISAHGHGLDTLTWAVHALMFFLFLFWGIYFIYVLWRFSSSRQKVADYEGVKTHASTYLEVFVAFVEVLLLVGLAIPLWSRTVDKLPTEKEATVVRIIAEQFAWNIHYPGPDGKFGRVSPEFVNPDNPVGLDRGGDSAAADDIVTMNDLHVPVGKPVLVQLTSKDVIHSLALWHLRAKQDANPGLVIPMHFTPLMTNDELRIKMPRHYKLPDKTLLNTSLTEKRKGVFEGLVEAGRVAHVDYASKDGAMIVKAGQPLTGVEVEKLVVAGIPVVETKRANPAPKEKVKKFKLPSLETADDTAMNILEGTFMTLYVPLGRISAVAIPEAGIQENQVIKVKDFIALINAGKKELDTFPLVAQEISCAQLCGNGHYRMKGFISVDTSEQFKEFMDREAKALAESLAQE